MLFYAAIFLLLPGAAAAAIPRRSLFSLTSALTARQRFPAPTAMAFIETQPSVRFSLRSLNISGASVPVACWTPAALAGADASSATEYPYAVDIGRIAARLRVGWLSWLPRVNLPLPCGTAPLDGLPTSYSGGARQGDAIIFAHGFLGSAYDCAHICEALASDGFLVCAPEMPESLAASYKPPESGITREEIIAASRELFGSQARRWGIFGHSAGAGSALYQRGSFPLGRLGLCGYRGGVETSDPVFLIASDGDGCNRFQQFSLRQILAAEARAGAKTTLFRSLDDAYATPRANANPRRGAFIFSAPEASERSELERARDDLRAQRLLTRGARGAVAVASEEPLAAPSSPPLPCHISFLWSASNNALVSLLAPLLPLAQALGLFVLDFDVFLRNRDSEATAARTAPAVRRFFLVGSGR